MTALVCTVIETVRKDQPKGYFLPVIYAPSTARRYNLQHLTIKYNQGFLWFLGSFNVFLMLYYASPTDTLSSLYG
jgi:hypothetical protein